MTYANSSNSWFTDFPIKDILTHSQKLDSWLVGRLIELGPHREVNGQPAILMATFEDIESDLVSRGWSKPDAARAIHRTVRGPAPIPKHALRLDLS